MQQHSDLTLDRKVAKTALVILVTMIFGFFAFLYFNSNYVDLEKFSKTFCLYDRDKIMNYKERMLIEDYCSKFENETKMKLSFLLLEHKKAGEKDILSKLPEVMNNEVRYIYRDYSEEMEFIIGSKISLKEDEHRQAVDNAISDLKLKTGVTALRFLFENAKSTIRLTE
jgi:hypothetical protein